VQAPTLVERATFRKPSASTSSGETPTMRQPGMIRQPRDETTREAARPPCSRRAARVCLSGALTLLAVDLELRYAAVGPATADERSVRISAITAEQRVCRQRFSIHLR